MDFRQEQHTARPASSVGLPPLQGAWIQSRQPGVARAAGQAHSPAPAPSRRAVQVTMVTFRPQYVRAPIPANGRQGQVRVSGQGQLSGSLPPSTASILAVPCPQRPARRGEEGALSIFSSCTVHPGGRLRTRLT